MKFRHTRPRHGDHYQVDYVDPGAADGRAGRRRRPPIASVRRRQGRSLLDRYEDEYHIPNFDKAVDFGWFYFLTKPIFYALDWLNSLLGNFGLAIMVFTVFVKALFFPLANNSYAR